jgi:hypothetical protein
MGYYGIPWYEKDRRGRPNRKKTLDKEFTTDKGKVVRSCMRGTVYYAIWQSEEDGSYVGLVSPTHMMDGELFYKPLSELDGPLHYAAPRSFIEFLEKNAPLEGDDLYTDGAREWRAKCLEHADEVRKKRIARNEWRRRYEAWRTSCLV